MFAVGCGQAKAPEKTDAAGGQKIVKDFSSNGTPQSVTRLNPDGRLLGTLYYSNGVPEHADYFDDQKRVRRTLFYRADGTAQTSPEFDERGRLVVEQQLGVTRAPIEKTP
jgi:hypothetical protein